MSRDGSTVGALSHNYLSSYLNTDVRIWDVAAAELLNGSIRSRHQLSGIVASHLIVSIPYITTRADALRARLRTLSIVLSVVVLLAVLGGLATTIVLGLPLDISLLSRLEVGFGATAD